MATTITDIKILIAEDQIGPAATALMELSADDDVLFNQVVLLKSQLSEYNRNTALNLTERNEQHAKIVNGLLYMADEIGKKWKSNTGPVAPKHATENAVVLRGETEIMALLFLNLHGYLTRNLESVMLSIHPDSPIYEQTADYTKQVFELGLTYKIHRIEVMQATVGEAMVKLVLETRKQISSPAFKDNLWTGIQHLVRDSGGHWRIWSGETLELKYIE